MAKLLQKLNNPTIAQARDFFNWEVVKLPIKNNEGIIIPGYNEFRSTKGHVLHVGNDTYTPAQPLIAFDKTIEAMDKLNLNYTANGVGSFDNDVNIFAQFDVKEVSGSAGAIRHGYNGGDFTVNGKAYKGFITMAKGNDGAIPLSYWLTIICIVCANTFRAALRARKGNNMAVTMKQTKGSGERLEFIQNEIVGLFGLQAEIQATLQTMAGQVVTLTEAEKAFLGLIKPVDGQIDLSKTGKTRLANSLELYKAAFANSPGVNSGNTREDWFNAVTNVATHGDNTRKAFDAEKQFVSSEFGTYAQRKEKAFAMASNNEAWQGLVQSGEQVMASLLSRPVVVTDSGAQDFAALLNR